MVPSHHETYPLDGTYPLGRTALSREGAAFAAPPVRPALSRMAIRLQRWLLGWEAAGVAPVYYHHPAHRDARLNLTRIK